MFVLLENFQCEIRSEVNRGSDAVDGNVKIPKLCSDNPFGD